MLEHIPLSYYTLSSLLNLITSSALAFFVLSKNLKLRVNQSFFLWAFTVAGWSFFYFLWLRADKNYLAEFYLRTLMLFVIFIPSTFTHFILTFIKADYNKRINRGNYLISFFLGLTAYTQLFASDGNSFLIFPYWLKPGPLFCIHSIHFFINIIYAHFLMLRALKRNSGIFRDQILYVLIGTSIGYSAGAINYLTWYRIPIPPFLNSLVSIYVAFVSYAIIKYRLMNIKIAFTRAGIFLAVYTMVLGIPFVILQRTGSGLFATSLAVILATIGPLIYRFLQVKAESIILAQQHRYQKVLLRTAIGMVTEHDLKKLSKLIVYILKNSIRIKFSAIFIRDRKNNSYHLEAIRGESNLGKYVESFSDKDPFIGYLKKNREYFFFEEAPEQIRSSSNILFKSKVVIPALIGDELLGFVFLGEKVNDQPYTNEDINVFKILSYQAALAIENCIFFEESKDSQQRMFAAEKLASIGGMADGLAHQIKNRLNLFSLAGGELKLEIKSFLAKHDPLIKSSPELATTFKYLDELGTSILDNVKRTDGIIKGILDFAKVEKKENFFAVFSFKETVELSSVLLMLKHEAASLPLNVKIDSQDLIYGVKSQLTEVIYNLLDNAYEAIKEKKMQLSGKNQESFSPAIELSLAHTPDRQIIKISDNGMGIKEEDRLKIFAPFFTTKSSYKSGSGIGVYVVKRIIEENHKGKIWFTSTYMEGTSFTIELPKKQ